METERLLRNRKGQCLPYNPWNLKAEPGDYMVDIHGVVWRLEESSGRDKRDLGDLTPRRIKPHRGFSNAVLRDGKIYWLR